MHLPAVILDLKDYKSPLLYTYPGNTPLFTFCSCKAVKSLLKKKRDIRLGI